MALPPVTAKTARPSLASTVTVPSLTGPSGPFTVNAAPDFTDKVTGPEYVESTLFVALSTVAVSVLVPPTGT